MKGTLATLAVLGLAAAGATSVALAATGAKPTHAKVTISPTKGTPSTRFNVHFKSLGTTGTSSLIADGYDVSVTGPGNTACVSSATKGTAPATAAKGARLHVVLNPSKFTGGRWCTGKFTGRVAELERPVCEPGKACPQFIVSHPVGDFSFRVSSGG